MARRLPSFRARVRLTPRARRIIVVSFLAVVAFMLAVLTAAWNRACAGNSCPSIAELGVYDPNQASKVYAADGRLIADLGPGAAHRRAPGRDVPGGQGRVRHHRGQALLRAPWDRLVPRVRRAPDATPSCGLAEGFSTITMQLARNIFHRGHLGATNRSAGSSRRPRSRARSRRKYPKDQILELYLNQIDLGNGAYGVETASQRYFGKSVRDLNWRRPPPWPPYPRPRALQSRAAPRPRIQRRNTC